MKAKTSSSKTVSGTIELVTPRERNSDFTPDIVKKRKTILAISLEPKIIVMYGLGMSLRDISTYIRDMYDTDISAATLSTITNKRSSRWQKSGKPALWMHCSAWYGWIRVHYKVKEEGRVATRCVYNILGSTTEGKRELMGMCVTHSEGANFWLSVLTDLQNRGGEDMLIASIDNLKGFAEAIVTVFPKTEVQSCIGHQLRNSLRCIGSKDPKEFMRDLKPAYQAGSKEAAEVNLEKLTEKWSKKYSVVISSWQKNREKLSTHFNYPAEIRKLIYTTNTIEGYHRQIRKVTKTKGALTSGMALC